MTTSGKHAIRRALFGKRELDQQNCCLEYPFVNVWMDAAGTETYEAEPVHPGVDHSATDAEAGVATHMHIRPRQHTSKIAHKQRLVAGVRI